MAKIVPFNQLKPDTTYWEQSRYWHKLLGPCKVTQFHEGIPLLVENETGSHYIEPNWDWFWDSEPTVEEQTEYVRSFFGWPSWAGR